MRPCLCGALAGAVPRADRDAALDAVESTVVGDGPRLAARVALFMDWNARERAAVAERCVCQIGATS